MVDVIGKVQSVQSMYKMFSSCIQPNLTVSSTDRESKIIISYGYQCIEAVDV